MVNRDSFGRFLKMGKRGKPKKQKRKPKRIFSERKQKGTPAKISKKRLDKYRKGRKR